MIDSYNPIKGIFLLILAVSGNFVAETFGCRTQQFLRENMDCKTGNNILNYLFCTIVYK